MSILIRHRNASGLAYLDTILEFITNASPYLLLSPCHVAED